MHISVRNQRQSRLSVAIFGRKPDARQVQNKSFRIYGSISMVQTSKLQILFYRVAGGFEMRYWSIVFASVRVELSRAGFEFAMWLCHFWVTFEYPIQI